MRVICILSLFGNADALLSATQEQTLTVAFIYNFLKFTEWPQTNEAGNSINVCIADSTPFRDEFGAIAGRSAQNKKVEIKNIDLGESLNECHLLFLPMEEKPVRVREWLKIAGKLPILTVGNQDTFLEMGGMIMLTGDANRLQFEVSLKPVKQAGLALDSQLLSIAHSVR